MNNNFKIIQKNKQRLWAREYSSDIGALKFHMDNNQFEFDTDYQREYVWTEKEQQEFLENLFNHRPLGTISLAVIDMNLEERYIEVVDGKQRLTTLKMFFDSEISYNGHFYKNLDVVEQRVIRNIKLPSIMLEPYYEGRLTEKDRVQYFYDINFSGVPQSDEHREKIKGMLK